MYGGLSLFPANYTLSMYGGLSLFFSKLYALNVWRTKSIFQIIYGGLVQMLSLSL